jgi:peptidoglycan/LPS O-acetylase OafA/YrhL
MIGALLYTNVTSDAWGFPAQLQVFMFGIVAASIIRQPPAFLRRDRIVGNRAARWIGVATFTMMTVVLPQTHYFSYVVFSACAAVLCVILHFAPSPILVNRVMSRVGMVSYSIYVLHFAFLAPTFAVARWLAPPGGGDLALLAIYFPLLTGVSFLAATLTWRLIEQPGIAIGRQLIGRLNAARTAPLKP